MAEGLGTLHTPVSQNLVFHENPAAVLEFHVRKYTIT
jgi:hypothetical protein